MQHSRSVGGVVIGPNGKIALASQHDTSWSFPKGRPKGNEDDAATFKRELQEETGLTQSQFIKHLGTYQRTQLREDGTEDRSTIKTLSMGLYTTTQTSLHPTDPDNPEARWVSPQQVAKLLTHPKDKAFYESVKDQVLEVITGLKP